MHPDRRPPSPSAASVASPFSYSLQMTTFIIRQTAPIQVSLRQCPLQPWRQRPQNQQRDEIGASGIKKQRNITMRKLQDVSSNQCEDGTAECPTYLAKANYGSHILRGEHI